MSIICPRMDICNNSCMPISPPFYVNAISTLLIMISMSCATKFPRWFFSPSFLPELSPKHGARPGISTRYFYPNFLGGLNHRGTSQLPRLRGSLEISEGNPDRNLKSRNRESRPEKNPGIREKSGMEIYTQNMQIN